MNESSEGIIVAGIDMEVPKTAGDEYKVREGVLAAHRHYISVLLQLYTCFAKQYLGKQPTCNANVDLQPLIPSFILAS